MASASGTSRATGPIAVRTLVRAGVVALVLSLVVNWVVAFGAIAADVAPALEALQYGSVTFPTALGVLGATVTYGVLTRVVDTPDRAFVVVAAIVLLASLIPDFTYIPEQPGGSLLAGAVLGTMHVTTAVVCAIVLTDVDVGARFG